jgi:predicted amidophosphoribosyltransferase
LTRHENAVSQHTLSAGRRAENARSSYAAAQNGTIFGRVLLVDDVMTTGATLDRCAALLRRCGAREVVCLTAATTLLRDE